MMNRLIYFTTYIYNVFLYVTLPAELSNGKKRKTHSALETGRVAEEAVAIY